LRLVAPTSGVVTITIPDNNTSPTFTLPNSLPLTAGQILQSDDTGSLSWVSIPVSSTKTSFLNNNVTTPLSIVGLSFTEMFKIDVYVTVSTTTDTYTAMYTLRGFEISSGWTLYVVYVGDDTGINFSITLDGQIEYISSNMNDWTNGRIAWMGPDMYTTTPGGIPQQVAGANNQTVAANVTGLIMSPPQFSAYILVTVNNTTVANSTVSLYQIQGTLQQNSLWSFTSQIVSGPDPGIRFSILSFGQIQYTSPNISGWISTTFQFYETTVPLQNRANYVGLNVSGGIDSNSTVSGDVTVAGGVGIGKKLHVGDTLIAGGAGENNKMVLLNGMGNPNLSISSNLSGNYTITVTDEATNDGWMNLYSGVTSGINLVAPVVIVTNTTDSTSLNTGALQIAGGVGINKSLYVGVTDVTIGNIAIFAGSSDQYIQMSLRNQSVQFNMTITGSTYSDFGLSGAGNFILYNNSVSSPAFTITTANDMTVFNNFNIQTTDAAYTKYYGKNQTTNYWQVGNEAGNANGQGNFVVYANGTTGTYIPWGGTSWVATSDERLKTNINSINDGLNVISKLRPVTFEWKDTFMNNGKKKLGLIAQEVMRFIPELVHNKMKMGDKNNNETEQDYYSVEYMGLIPILIAAIQELNEKTKYLESRINELKGFI
jgi:hypothetical protein